MSAIKKLKELLGTPPHIYELSPLNFPHLDHNKLRDELRLEELGRERGLEHQPPSDATSMDAVETSITTRIEKEAHQDTAKTQDHLATFNQRLTALNLQRHFTSVQTAARQAISEFKAEIIQRENGLTWERDNVIDSRKHFKQFRDKNNLVRPANYPDSHVFYYGIVAVFCVVEMVLNGFFLALGDQFGLLGGAAQAFLISLLNIGFAFLIGRYGLPQLNHVRIWRRLVGLTCLLVYPLFVSILNLAVAHYRDALLSGLVDPSKQAIKTFIEGPYGIIDFQSWIMVGIGWLFSLMALIDGYKISDPYPSYEYEARQHLRLYDDYIGKVDAAIDALRFIRDTAVEDLQSLRLDLAERCTSHEHILTHRTRFMAQFKDHLDYLEMVANDLLTIYRTANRMARGTVPVPPHFERRWSLPRTTETIPSPPSLAPEALEATLKKTDASLEQSINDLYDAFENSLPNFERIKELN